jgi:hypothetical protein
MSNVKQKSRDRKLKGLRSRDLKKNTTCPDVGGAGKRVGLVLPTVQEDGRAPEPITSGAKNLAPTGIRSPGFNCVSDKNLASRSHWN